MQNATDHTNGVETVLARVGLALCVLAAWPCASAAAETPKAEPIWSINFTESDYYGRYANTKVQVPPAEIAFIADNKVAVSFLAPRSAFAQRPDNVRPGQIDRVSIIVNTNTRKVEKTLTWTTPYGSRVPVDSRRLLFPTNKGEFVVYTGAKLLRYSSDFELLQERPVSDPIKTQILISANRSLFLITDFVRTARFKEVLVSTSDLKNEKYFGENDRPSSGVTDEGQVVRLRLSQGSLEKGRKGTNFSGCTQSSANYPYSQKTCGVTHPGYGQDAFLCSADGTCKSVDTEVVSATLLRDDVVFVDTAETKGTLADRGFALLDLGGKVLYKRLYDDSRREQRSASISCAVSAPRFSFSTGQISFGKNGLNWVENLHVFDMTVRDVIASFSFKGEGAARIRRFDHAVSPDGTRLVILKEREVALYALP